MLFNRKHKTGPVDEGRENCISLHSFLRCLRVNAMAQNQKTVPDVTAMSMEI